MDTQHIGRMLIGTGLVLAAVGVVLVVAGKLPWLGKLPGDFMFQHKNFTFYFPLATSILVSIILTLIFWLFGRR